MSLTIRLLAKLPLRLLHALGAVLGWLVYLGSSAYRRNFRQNTRRAALSAEKTRGAIAASGQMALELPWVWLRPEHDKRAAIQWDGIELIESALSAGRGLIYLTPHMGCFEVLPPAHAHWLADRYGPITVLYRPSRSSRLNQLTMRNRVTPGVQTAPTSTAGVRSLLRALRQGRAVGLLPDQVPEAGFGVWAPFFGQPAYTMTLPLRLARRSGAPMLLVYGERLERGRGFLIHVRSVDLALEQPDEVLAATMNLQLERLILEHPSLYLWGYARYKHPVSGSGRRA